jgi:hypothetical protein
MSSIPPRSRSWRKASTILNDGHGARYPFHQSRKSASDVDPDDPDTSIVGIYLDGRVAFVRAPLQIGNSQLRKLLALYGVTDEKFFSRKMDQLFDPDAAAQQSREDALLAGLEALPAAMRDALIERFELMLNAAQLAAASSPPHRNTPPVPSIARPAGF